MEKEGDYYDDFSSEEEESESGSGSGEGVINMVSEFYENSEESPCFLLGVARQGKVLPQVLELGLEGLADYNSMYCQIQDLIKLDDKDQFANFLIHYHPKLLTFGPQCLFTLLLHHGAVGCVSAFLDSQLRSHVDLNFSKKPPLSIAALRLSSPLVTLLLHHGADPDLGLRWEGPPLRVAISCFSSLLRRHWNPRKSTIIELFRLVFSPEMQQPLDSVKVLASQSKQVENIFFSCVANREILQVATLLTAASDKLLALQENGLENTPVVQSILTKLKFDANQLYERTSDWISSSTGKPLLDAFNVVKTFCLVNGLTARYGQSVLEDLSKLVREGWLRELSHKDNTESVVSKITMEAKELSQKHHGLIIGGFAGERRLGIAGFSTLPSSSNFPNQAYSARRGFHFNHLKLVETQSKCRLVKPSLMKKVAPIMWLAKRSIK